VALNVGITGDRGTGEELAAGDRMVQLLLTIPGCGEILAWTIRAYTDDIRRFASAKKFTAFAGLVPWVQDSNETVRHGKITKRGLEELRTALVQVVLGLRRMKEKTKRWRLMERYELLKGSGKTITSTARKLAVIIWHMLSEDVAFDVGKMVDGKLRKHAENRAQVVEQALARRQNPDTSPRGTTTKVNKAGVASKPRKKAG
jgi:hypothetical protein